MVKGSELVDLGQVTVDGAPASMKLLGGWDVAFVLSGHVVGDMSPSRRSYWDVAW